MNYTLEQVFNHIAYKLLEQNKKCHIDGDCLYRHGKLKCAAGHCIKDEDYESKMEDVPIRQIIHNFNLDYLEEYTDLLEDMQSIHDVYEPDNWEDLFRGYALGAKYAYNPKPIQEFS